MPSILMISLVLTCIAVVALLRLTTRAILSRRRFSREFRPERRRSRLGSGEAHVSSSRSPAASGGVSRDSRERELWPNARVRAISLSDLLSRPMAQQERARGYPTPQGVESHRRDPLRPVLLLPAPRTEPALHHEHVVDQLALGQGVAADLPADRLEPWILARSQAGCPAPMPCADEIRQSATLPRSDANPVNEPTAVGAGARGTANDASSPAVTDRDPSDHLVAEVLMMVGRDPKSAESLPAGVLLRSWILLDQQNEHLQEKLDRSLQKARMLDRKVRQLSAKHARVTGRMEQVNDLVAALHDNLEDLRHPVTGAAAGTAETEEQHPVSAGT